MVCRYVQVEAFEDAPQSRCRPDFGKELNIWLAERDCLVFKDSEEEDVLGPKVNYKPQKERPNKEVKVVADHIITKKQTDGQTNKQTKQNTTLHNTTHEQNCDYLWLALAT